MNKIILVALITLSVSAVRAQQGNFQQPSVEDRVKNVHQKLDSAFKLEPSKLAKADTAFAVYYRGTDKLRQDLMSGGERPDMQVMREKMQPLTDTRDKELQTILTPEQYESWKKEVEPLLNQRRGGRPRQ